MSATVQSNSKPVRLKSLTLTLEEWRYLYQLALTEYHAPAHERHAHIKRPEPESALLVKLRKAVA